MIVTYRTVPVDELNVFYREAGDPDAPTVLLLRGFPTSSHMFRVPIRERSSQPHRSNGAHRHRNFLRACGIG
jgi:pimeloyl-ACP methyl ester carboxylesterase